MSKQILLIAILIFTGCAPTLKLRNKSLQHPLGICVNYNTNDSAFISLCDAQLDTFITKYNFENHLFKIQKCPSNFSSSLLIDFVDTRLVTTTEQATAMIVSAAGIALPIALIATHSSFVIGFVYLPSNKSIISASLSSDIKGNSSIPILANMTSNPFFGNNESQKLRHSAKMSATLYELMNRIEEEKN